MDSSAAQVDATARPADCPLCQELGGVLVWQGAACRVIRATDTPAFPVFYRVVWQAHVAEFSDLPPAERSHCMQVVAQVEAEVRGRLTAWALPPTKMNLAALGNQVPHLHWHIIARYASDSHFPAPLWAAPVRPRDAVLEAQLLPHLPEIDAALRLRLATATA